MNSEEAENVASSSFSVNNIGDPSSDSLCRIANYSILGHSFYAYRSKRSKSCSFEDKPPGADTNLLKCEYCHLIVHHVCREKVDFCCKTEFLSENAKETFVEGQEYKLRHYYVKRYETCHFKTSWKCAWCHDITTEDPSNKKPMFCAQKEGLDLIFFRYNTGEVLGSTEDENGCSENVLSKSICIGSSPTFVFINRKSGSKNAGGLIRKFNWCLTAHQVGDLSIMSPMEYLLQLSDVKGLHLVVCGGDGTVGWVLDEAEKCEFLSKPTISIVPVGTGNDLARCLKWGKAYKGTPVLDHMLSAKNGEEMFLDRWSIRIESIAPQSAGKAKTYTMQNYFSIGVDAKVVHSFHKWRENKTGDKGSRLMNKAVYAQKGALAMVKNSSREMEKSMGYFQIDDKNRYDEFKSYKPGSVLFLNITSYSSGTNPWGSRANDSYQQPMINDGKLEVMLLQQFDLVKLQIGGSCHRFAQCGSAKLRIDNLCFAQIDGEPVSIEHSIVEIALKSKVNMKIPK